MQDAARPMRFFFGAIGGSKWDSLPLGTRPEAGLLGLRQELGLYINLRPTRLRPSLRGISPLRPERLVDCDFEIVRELAGDIYFGEHKIEGEKGKARARDVANYSVPEIERVARYAFERAAARKRQFDQRGQSQRSGHFHALAPNGHQSGEGISGSHARSSCTWITPRCRSCCGRRNSTSILTSNIFGDIFSDEAAALAGSIGLIPSMSRGAPNQPALYEPIHGSAPTLAGKDVACPLGAILSATMMLRESFGLEIEAQWIETAIDRALDQGYRTSDIAEPGGRSVRSSELTEQIRSELHDVLVHHERYGWGV